MLSKERRNMGKDESGCGNDESGILCCRCLLVFGKVCVATQLIAASCTGQWSGCHILKTFCFPPSSRLLNVSHLLCLGQKSPLIIILLYYIIVLSKKKKTKKVQGSWW